MATKQNSKVKQKACKIIRKNYKVEKLFDCKWKQMYFTLNKFTRVFISKEETNFYISCDAS